MEVLSKTDVTQLGDNGWLIMLFFATVFVAIVLFSILVTVLSEGAGSWQAVIALFVLVVAFGIATYYTYGWASEEVTQYKVKVSDFNEVHEDYKIIEQEGEIFTVIKKEDE